MAALNDFKDWLNEVGLEENEYEHASNMVHSLRNLGKCGLFNTQVASVSVRTLGQVEFG